MASPDYAQSAIDVVTYYGTAYCKFLSANDTGVTGSHQAGILVSKRAVSILFDQPGVKGSNCERWVQIHWQDTFVTTSRFVYYGQGTRNEYRITNFGRGFPFLAPEFTGALLVLVQRAADDYLAYVLNSDDEIDSFLAAFALTPADTNQLIGPGVVTCTESAAIAAYLKELTVAFPSSQEVSAAARAIALRLAGHQELRNPDGQLVQWIKTEFNLFKSLEQRCYMPQISAGFASVEQFLVLANEVLNRRKSRAGKSLEHHLAALFDANGLVYSAQAVTEGKKRPDFIFPSVYAYHDTCFPVERLVSLAAKTTCKDRWRQILNEADRLRDRPKYLCTLQPGISPAQLEEMHCEQVVLVVPKDNLSYFPQPQRERIMTLYDFIQMVQSLQA